MKRIFLMLLIVAMCFNVVGCADLLGLTTADTTIETDNTTKSPSSSVLPMESWQDVEVDFDENSKLLKICYLDVGQGDSIFIVLPDGKTMLIDASISSQSDKIIDYIKKSGYTLIDYVVATHPHADHIGGMAAVLSEFDIGTMYMLDVTTNTKTFEKMLDVIEQKEITVKRASNGVQICSGEGFSVKIVAPCSEEYDDLNDYSAVIRIEYGKRAFMFMGDAHVESEDEITENVKCDVVKVGHHGSNTSSGQSFVDKAQAKYAIISVGEGNDYGHPHSTSVEKWQKSGAEILRTDHLGDIIVATDGEKISITTKSGNITDGENTEIPNVTSTPTVDATTEPDGATPTPEPTDEVDEYLWVLNTSTKKIHKPGCSSVKQINESNKAYSNKSIAELESEGYSICKICYPGR